MKITLALALALCLFSSANARPQAVGPFSTRATQQAPEPSLNELEADILRLTNLERSQAGLAPLLPQPALIRAAREHSQEMLTLSYFDHQSPNAAMPWDRVELTGFQTSQVAENLFEAEGYSAQELARAAVRAWMASPPHRHVLLNQTVVFGGIGISHKGDKFLVTQVLSGPEDHE